MCPHTTTYYHMCPHTTIYQVHSPKLQNAAPEGGSAVFHVDFFGANASLAQSPQIYKQMAGA